MTNVTFRGPTNVDGIDPRSRRHLLLVVNPSASGVTARNRVVIQNALASEHELEVVETHRRGHATRFAQGAASRGVDVVIALGGDGTVNEVANGLVRSQTALGVLPGGSTNVFARQLGFDNEPVAATDQLLAGLRSGTARRIGLGNVNGRYFCFHVGMGFDAAVVAKVESFGQLKRWLGHPLFLYAAVSTWVRGYDRKRPHFTAEVAGTPRPSVLAERPRDALGAVRNAARAISSRLRPADIPVVTIDGYFAVALNVDPYTYLGPRPLSLAPQATIDTPLTLVTLKTLALAPTIRSVAMALRDGSRVHTMPGIDVREHLHGFTVRGRRPFPWQVDGDHLGDTDLLEFRWEPEAMALVLPGVSGRDQAR